MSSNISMRMMIGIAILAAFSYQVVAQTQQQAQPQTQPQTQQQAQQQQQNTQQQQPAQQPGQKPQSLWQRLKASAKQTGQNTVQQGTQGIQQGAQQVQQGAQQGVQGVQQQVQQIPGQASNAAFGGANGGTASSNSSCGASCFDAGPFQAAVTQMTMSQQGYWHIIRMNMQFHNSTNQPLIIAYREGSMVMVDNNGNTYIPAGGSPGELQGMGIDRGSQTDSGFQLNPGQTGNAMFTVARQRGNDSAIGTGFTYNLTIDELQQQNGAQAAVVRQYNMNFPTLAPSTVAASAPGNGFLGSKSNAVGTGVATTTPATTVTTAGAAAKSTTAATATRGTAAPVQRVQPGTTPTVVKTATPATAVNAAAVRSTTTTTTTTAAKPTPAVKTATTTTTKKPAVTTAPAR